MNPNGEEIRKYIRQECREAWRPRESFRIYFAPLSRGLWRYAIAVGRRHGWRAGFVAYLDGTYLMGRGEIPWW
jgi:hypothetical protein